MWGVSHSSSSWLLWLEDGCVWCMETFSLCGTHLKYFTKVSIRRNLIQYGIVMTNLKHHLDWPWKHTYTSVYDSETVPKKGLTEKRWPHWMWVPPSNEVDSQTQEKGQSLAKHSSLRFITADVVHPAVSCSCPHAMPSPPRWPQVALPPLSCFC